MRVVGVCYLASQILVPVCSHAELEFGSVGKQEVPRKRDMWFRDSDDVLYPHLHSTSAIGSEEGGNHIFKKPGQDLLSINF